MWPKPICSIIIVNKSFSSAKAALACSFGSSGKNHHHRGCHSNMRSRGLAVQNKAQQNSDKWDGLELKQQDKTSEMVTATRKITNTIVKCQQCGLVFNNYARQLLKIQAMDISTLPKKASIVDVYKLEVPITWLLEGYYIYTSPPGVNVTVPDVYWVNLLAPRVVTNSLLLPQKHQEYTQDKTAQ